MLSQRVSFLYNAVVDFREHVHTSGQDAITVDMLALSVGLPCNVDPALCNALQAEKELDAESDYNNSCLLMVFIAVSLRVLIRSETTVYSPRLDAHPNNCHCFAQAINAVAGALFTLHRRGDVEERLQEFLAVSQYFLFKNDTLVQK